VNLLVISADRRFREMAAVLLARRGCEVVVGDETGGLAQRIERQEIEVVVIDASRSLAAAARVAAAVQAMSRPVGIVVVEDHPRATLAKLQTLPKWGAFGELFAAIEHAYDDSCPSNADPSNGAPSNADPSNGAPSNGHTRSDEPYCSGGAPS
jgi:DNA-binding NtrC family response regulator